jgi:hypothetical protein
MAATITPESVWDKDRFPNLETQVGQVMWPTARATDGEKGGPNQSGSKGDLMLPSAVNQQWPTPRGYSHQDSNRPGINQLDAEVRQLPSAKLKWSTPRAEERQQTNSQDGYVALSKQVSDQWNTPQARDWKGQQGRAYKETANDLPAQIEGPRNLKTGQLNPRWVETLMGLPIGWTTPSCARPWIVVLMNSDSSETGLTPMSLPRLSSLSITD